MSNIISNKLAGKNISIQTVIKESSPEWVDHPRHIIDTDEDKDRFWCDVRETRSERERSI